MLSFGAIVVLLGGLIFVHELGHFVVAKLLGVKVVRFSIGFGPRLLGVRRGETEYRLSALPLGGYVKMAGDDPNEVLAPEDRGRGFLEQPPWKRLVIALAGPGMNLAFPLLVYCALWIGQNGEKTPGPYIGTVQAGSPAAQAGLLPGDRILSVAAPGEDPRPVRYFGDLSLLVSPHPRERLTFAVERDGRRIEPIAIVPAVDEDSNGLETTRRGVIGVTPSYAPAIVAPAAPGAAGPVQPFDLVVSAAGRPVKNLLELQGALRAAACGPLDLEVVRERPVVLPGAAVSTAEKVALLGVPTCREGAPALLPASPSLSTFVASVEPGSAAEKAGLRRGDAIAAVNGTEVHNFREIQAVSRTFQIGQPIALALRDGRTLSFVPSKTTIEDEITGKAVERLVPGFTAARREPVDPEDLLVPTVPLQRGVAEIAGLAWRELSEVVRLTVLGIARIVTGAISFKQVGGPLMLVDIASKAAAEGLSSFLFHMALISVNLGLMNLLPIPVLDGGHIATAVVESVTRRPLSIRAREIANLVGLILLVTLMLFVFKNDIWRLMKPPPG
jgi:regulator of sigma E protease